VVSALEIPSTEHDTAVMSDAEIIRRFARSSTGRVQLTCGWCGATHRGRDETEARAWFREHDCRHTAPTSADRLRLERLAKLRSLPRGKLEQLEARAIELTGRDAERLLRWVGAGHPPAIMEVRGYGGRNLALDPPTAAERAWARRVDQLLRQARLNARRLVFSPEEEERVHALVNLALARTHGDWRAALSLIRGWVATGTLDLAESA
jgi:hypothetical protein